MEQCDAKRGRGEQCDVKGERGEQCDAKGERGSSVMPREGEGSSVMPREGEGSSVILRERIVIEGSIHASGEYCVRGSADVRGEVHVLTRAAVNIERSWRVESY